MSGPAWHTVHIHPAAPAKPAYGQPCNGCGQCCLVEPCPLGMVVSRKRSGACDALRWHDQGGRYVCGLVADPAQVLGSRWRWLAPLVARLARRWISAGSGCDAALESADTPRQP